MTARKPLPEHLRPYWGNRVTDPRDKPGFCYRQSLKTPAIPWHNSSPCLACGKGEPPFKIVEGAGPFNVRVI